MDDENHSYIQVSHEKKGFNTNHIPWGEVKKELVMDKNRLSELLTLQAE